MTTSGGHSGPQLPYKVIAGVVPCRGAWLVASAKLQGVNSAPEEPQLVESFLDVIDSKPAYTAIALYAPIGLPDEPVPGGRTCDRAARSLLGPMRGRTVRSSPSWAAFTESATDRARGLDAVTLNLIGTYREVASEMASYLQRVIYEANPELSFYDLNEDRPLKHSKRRVAGREERRSLLVARMPGIDRVLDADLPVREAHLLDAAACLWTARRIVARAIVRLPADPEWDSQGLRMELVR